MSQILRLGKRYSVALPMAHRRNILRQRLKRLPSSRIQLVLPKPQRSLVARRLLGLPCLKTPTCKRISRYWFMRQRVAWVKDNWVVAGRIVMLRLVEDLFAELERVG